MCIYDGAVQTETIMLCGTAATNFAHKNGLQRVPQETLQTKAMERALQNRMDKFLSKEDLEKLVVPLYMYNI